jgi:hypothetical protein
MRLGLSLEMIPSNSVTSTALARITTWDFRSRIGVWRYTAAALLIGLLPI